MKRQVIRTGSAVLAACMMLSATTSCNKKDGNEQGGESTPAGAAQTLPESGEEVVADSTWFDTSVMRIDGEYDEHEYEYLNYDFIGMSGDTIAMRRHGQRIFPADVDYEDLNFNDYNVESVEYYDLSGNQTGSVNLDDLYSQIPGQDEDYIRVEEARYDGDYLLYTLACMEPDTWNEEIVEVKIDASTGEIAECSEGSGGGEDINGNLERTYKIGDLSVSQYYMWDDDGGYIITVDGSDGTSWQIDLRQELPGKDIFDISNMVPLGDDSALAPYVGLEEGAGYLLFDFASRTCTEYEEDMSWLGRTDIVSAVPQEDGTLMYVGTDGLTRIDTLNRTTELILDFNNCNVNRFDAMNLTFEKMENGRFIFSGTDWIDDEMGTYPVPYIMTFTETDNNPNAGKTYIRATCPEGFTYEAAEAVRIFNDESEDGFIVFDYSYMPGYEDPLGCTYDEFAAANLSDEATLSNRLAMDLMTGDGPDIIFGTIGYYQLNSDDYLMDLSDMLPDEELFDNVIDAARVNGRLYQIPLDCGFKGITASSSDVGYDASGFTFDTYEDFVDTVCNGEDPIGYGRLDYLELLYCAMNDRFTGPDGNVSYDNDDFRSLVDFAGELPEEGLYDGECSVCERENETVGYVMINSLSDYLASFGGSSAATRLMGLPSSDGRGPVISVTESIGISANTASPEICEEFLQYVLSYDGQMLFAGDYKTPVNVRAFEAGAQDAIEAYNAQVQDLLTYLTRDEIAACGFFAEEVDESVIEAYEGFIRSACTIETRDPALLLIVREELPAYFAGQKTLDEVVEILQNRAETYVNERG